MTSDHPKAKDLPVLLFEQQGEWAKWLETNHAASGGVWLQFAKKGSGMRSLTYGEALEVALCYGWIDGQARSHDESSWLQRFTPRGARSIWSKINRERAQQLIDRGQMRPAGLLAIERAKRNGRWDAAYDSARTSVVPDDLQAALDGNAEAKAFFATLNSANRYAILFRIQTATTPQTRAKRIQQMVAMLEQHEQLHP